MFLWVYFGISYKKLYNTKKIVDLWLDLLEVGYIIVFLSSYRYICDQLYVANYMLYIIILYRFKIFVGGPIHPVQNN